MNIKEIYSTQDNYTFTIADREFNCNREIWGNNNHKLWIPDVNTNDDWNIDTSGDKAFRTREKCVNYMCKQIEQTLKEMLKD